jgi:hypothetical protein
VHDRPRPWPWTVRPGGVYLIALLALSFSNPALGDEVDDILALKNRNLGRIQRFSGVFTVDTVQPKGLLKEPKTLRLRYQLHMTKLPPQARKAMHQPWRIEAEVLEPNLMHLLIEGEQAFFMDPHGNWSELPMTPEIREQFLGMGERFMGGTPGQQRQHNRIKVIRRNNRIFGPDTVTLEHVPQGKSKAWHRLEEDVNADGLALETRLFDAHGKQTVKIKVKKRRKIDGVPVVEALESVAETPAGAVVSRTTCTNLHVECSEP